MLRTLLRLLFVVLILIAVGAFFYGYRWGGNRNAAVNQPDTTIASSDTISRERARQAGAEIADKVAAGANRAEEALSAASLTAKIKSKMALDDTLDASRINVDTNGTEVTLTGILESNAQRQRALQLARETDGVTAVVDRLAVAVR